MRTGDDEGDNRRDDNKRGDTYGGYGDHARDRAVAAMAVLLLHAALIGIIVTQSPRTFRVLPRIFTAMLITPQKPPPPPPPVEPALQAPNLLAPAPDFKIAQQTPPQTAARTAPIRPTPKPVTPARPHFGADTSHAILDLDVTAQAGGGAGTRVALGGFEAGVRGRVAGRKHQPILPKDMRNTCLINYTVTIDRAGRMLGFKIDPCTVEPLNDAARDAIRAAAPFAPPPDTGASTYHVRGSLVFEP